MGSKEQMNAEMKVAFEQYKSDWKKAKTGSIEERVALRGILLMAQSHEDWLEAYSFADSGTRAQGYCFRKLAKTANNNNAQHLENVIKRCETGSELEMACQQKMSKLKLQSVR